MSQKRKEKKLEKERKRRNKERSINRDILKIAIGIAVLFICMAVYFVYFIEVRSSAAINNTYNKRSEEFKEKVVRGEIYANDGETLLAQTVVTEDGNEYREYPFANLYAHVVGFEDNGGLGIESSYNYYLLSSNIAILDKLKNEYKNVKSQGNSLVTTLDHGLQQKINDVLSYAGSSAAIAIDPDTGEILSLVSKPDFDPNTISQIWDEIVAEEENSILVNRATQGLYAPGSTFKIFTLAEYLKEHPSDYEEYSYDCSGEYAVEDMIMHCYGNTAHGPLNLEQSLAYSCNCSFANIGAGLDLQKFRANNRKLLFDADLPIDISCSRSSFALDSDASAQEIVQTSIGQGNTLVTPAHLAVVMSAIANDGILMKPHLGKEVRNEEGALISTFSPAASAVLFDVKDAGILKEYLRGVVTSGTALNLSYGNYTAYGKTGTAETISNYNVDSEASDHSWFVGWAEQDGKKMVLCVMIEKAQDTWGSAAQFSQEIFDYYFQR